MSALEPCARSFWLEDVAITLKISTLRFYRDNLVNHDPNAPKRYIIDPYTRDEVATLLDTAGVHYPEW